MDKVDRLISAETFNAEALAALKIFRETGDFLPLAAALYQQFGRIKMVSVLRSLTGQPPSRIVSLCTWERIGGSESEAHIRNRIANEWSRPANEVHTELTGLTERNEGS